MTAAAGDPAYVVWGFWFLFAMFCIAAAGIFVIFVFILLLDTAEALRGADTGDRP